MASFGRPDLIPAHRRTLMLEQLRLQSAASIHDLCEATGASASTVRRDLQYLEEQGLIERTHGGALFRHRPPRGAPGADGTPSSALEEKAAIGRLAAAQLSPGQSVIFDSSSTVLRAAEALVVREIALTAVTNDLGIASALAVSPAVRLVVLGGSLRPGSMTLTGEPGQDFLRNLNADVALIGAHSVARSALTEPSLEAAGMKRAMVHAAQRVILLVDASKFGPPALCRICDLASIHEVITDDRLSSTEVARLRDSGLTVRIAGTSN